MNNLIRSSTKLAGTLAACTALPAAGAVLMLDFGPTVAAGGSLTNSPYHTEDSSFTDSTWNTIGLADEVSLFYADGSSATGVALDLGSVVGGSTIDLSDQPGKTNALGSATFTGVYSGTSVGKDGIFDGNAGNATRVGAQITGLDAGIYDVFVTARNTNVGDSSHTTTTFVGAGVAGVDYDSALYSSQSLTYPSFSSFTADWVDGENYVKQTVTVMPGEAINIAVAGTPTADRGFLNSIQIVLVPEPASLALVACGVLALAIRDRRVH
ncbi:MAG: PEP-CTERM sorting domain-containing protein [Planctomycetota bacterium]